MIEYIVLSAVIPKEVSEEKKAEYFLSKMFRIVGTVSNGKPQKVWLFFSFLGFFFVLFFGQIKLDP